MDKLNTEGQNWINQLKTRYIGFSLSAIILICAGISLIIYSLVNYFYPLTVGHAIFLLLATTLISLWIKPVYKTTSASAIRFADKKYPELEESAYLLVENPENLALLQKFQLQKIVAILPQLEAPKEPLKKLYSALLFLFAALAISYGLTFLPSQSKLQQSIATNNHPNEKAAIKENIPVEIIDFRASITPPKYTNKPTRSQKQFALLVESGATVTWQIQTKGDIKSLKLIFNDKEYINLNNKGLNTFNYSKKIDNPGFYQVELDGKKSDLYQIEIIPDLPINIKISEPKQHTTIDIGQPQKINLKVQLTDDYGISNAFISATMASGKGEGVSFTEKKLSFDHSFQNEKSKTLLKPIDLKNLGMKPGDELYFFIQALDNHGQTSRSDVYFVSIADTTELMSLVGMTSGVSLVPEYFRSQRQIIIDTEQLIKDQATIALDKFKTRSNDLGFDQKLLRLKYGQFLGEENETKIGGDGDAHDDHETHETQEMGQSSFGNVTSLMDEYAHKHDTAEDATFFEPEVKAQLKAVLNEMWNTELRLRTFKPQEALPYAYKALRLLKDLQQSSRAFVAKTTVKTANLKPEKRLSGTLDKITQPIHKAEVEKLNLDTEQLKKALSILDLHKTGKAISESEKYFLSETEKQMIVAASSQPSIYLRALKSLRILRQSNAVNPKDITIVQFAIQKMIDFDPSKPQAESSEPASILYKSYFKQIN